MEGRAASETMLYRRPLSSGGMNATAPLRRTKWVMCTKRRLNFDELHRDRSFASTYALNIPQRGTPNLAEKSSLRASREPIEGPKQRLSWKSWQTTAPHP